MFAQYSPLFTAGLHSDSSPTSSRSSSPKRRIRRLTRKSTRPDSLPVTVNSATFSCYSSHPQRESTSSALYLTFKPSRRRQQEGTSFLSLDLADTMSLRRKDTVTTRAASVFANSEPTSPVSPKRSPRFRNAFAHSHAQSASSVATVIPRVSTSVLRRSSRETMRLPSPKPVPSISLPEVPASSQPQPQKKTFRPSDLTLSSCFPESSFTSFLPPTPDYDHRSVYSAPSILSPISSPYGDDDIDSSYFPMPPSSIPPTPPPSGTRADTLMLEPQSAPAAYSLKASPSCRSTASIATRQRNRSAALAALEGRGRTSTGRRRAASIKRNFISMSDDEDDEDENDAPLAAHGHQDKKIALAVLNEEEDIVLPNLAVKPFASPSKSAPSSRRWSRASKTSATSETKRSRRSTIESFFAPLTNFLDFRECDDDARSTRTSWRRSIVELGS